MSEAGMFFLGLGAALIFEFFAFILYEVWRLYRGQRRCQESVSSNWYANRGKIGGEGHYGE